MHFPHAMMWPQTLARKSICTDNFWGWGFCILRLVRGTGQKQLNDSPSIHQVSTDPPLFSSSIAINPSLRTALLHYCTFSTSTQCCKRKGISLPSLSPLKSKKYTTCGGQLKLESSGSSRSEKPIFSLVTSGPMMQRNCFLCKADLSIFSVLHKLNSWVCVCWHDKYLYKRRWGEE